MQPRVLIHSRLACCSCFENFFSWGVIRLFGSKYNDKVSSRLFDRSHDFYQITLVFSYITRNDESKHPTRSNSQSITVGKCLR